MRPLTLALALSTLVAAPVALLADTVPYSHTGTVATYVPVYAASTGNLTFTFVTAGQTGYIDAIAFHDVTEGTTSAPFFYNGGPSASAPGSTQSFSVVQGDLLDFIVYIFVPVGVTPVTPQHSMPIFNADGFSHAFVTAFAGGSITGSAGTFPAGIYVGMEDLPNSIGSDFNYNDEAFVLTNATFSAPVPEPGTLSLLGTGLLAAAGVARRRSFFGR